LAPPVLTPLCEETDDHWDIGLDGVSHDEDVNVQDYCIYMMVVAIMRILMVMIVTVAMMRLLLILALLKVMLAMTLIMMILMKA